MVALFMVMLVLLAFVSIFLSGLVLSSDGHPFFVVSTLVVATMGITAVIVFIITEPGKPRLFDDMPYGKIYQVVSASDSLSDSMDVRIIVTRDEGGNFKAWKMEMPPEPCFIKSISGQLAPFPCPAILPTQ